VPDRRPLQVARQNHLNVIAGLVPAISMRRAPCQPKRDSRNKSGHDKCSRRAPCVMAPDMSAIATKSALIDRRLALARRAALD
jgi:hypothetical protein